MLCRIYIDEAWRWPLAWPLFVWLILQIWNISNQILFQFKDSKKLSENQRKQLLEQIKQLEKENKIIYSLWITSAKEIDNFWVTKAINLAISRWIFSLLKKFYENHLKKHLQESQFWRDLIKNFEIEKNLNKKEIFYEDIKKLIKLIFSTNDDYQAVNLKNIILPPEYKLQAVLIDWNSDFWLQKDLWIKIITIIDWDAKIPQISMASILAKVSRDEYMKKISHNYPQYNFEQHKGYRNPIHIENIKKYGLIPDFHRKRFLINLAKDLKNKQNLTKIEKEIVIQIEQYKNDLSNDLFWLTIKSKYTKIPTKAFNWPILINKNQKQINIKPWLLLHICCAPDLTRPLRRLKNYFKLYLRWYNPNIHPIEEHKKRYDQYIKLLNLEKWDYEILEDYYNPKEFFDYLEIQFKNKYWKNFTKKEILDRLSLMEEKNSDRCWRCYDLRLLEAAKMAEKHNIPYFTTTLLISPKKDLTHLFLAWIKAQLTINNKSKFLFFDFKKDKGFEKAAQICKDYNIRRQNYCGCIRSVR